MILGLENFIIRMGRIQLIKAGAHQGGGGIHPLPSKRKVSLNSLFAPKMPHKSLKCPVSGFIPPALP